MKDSIVQVTLAGAIGALVMDLLIFLILLLGIEITPPWSIAADVFLSSRFVSTTSGLILGLIGTLALSIATAMSIYLVLRLTGYDYAIFKGILTTNAFSFISMGLFMPLLNIAPQIQKQPLTNFAALISLSLTGAIISYFFKKFSVQKVIRE